MGISKIERETAIRLKDGWKREFRRARLLFAIAGIALGVVALVLGILQRPFGCLVVGIVGFCCVLQSWDAHEMIASVKRRPNLLFWPKRDDGEAPTAIGKNQPAEPSPGARSQK